MEQRVSLITLGVTDLARARAFYEALGWRTDADAHADVVFFQAGGMIVALWDRGRLAEDSGVEDGGGWGGVTLAYNVDSPAEGDAVLAEAAAVGARIPRSGAETFWGGYSGVFVDPDGHPWEVAHNPHWRIGADGTVHLNPSCRQHLASLEAAAVAYDVGRPSYPPGIYDALGPLEGTFALEGGAGTGIATRQLLERGADVVAFDVGPALLAKARARTNDVMAVVANGARLPFRDACADLICFAQSWHWLDEGTRCAEASRVLRPGGRWAGWWSQARADGEPWFDHHWDLMMAAVPGLHPDQRDLDGGAELAASGLFAVDPRITVAWTRELSIDHWVTDQSTQSYVAVLPEPERQRLLAGLRDLLDAEFPGGVMTVPYETWLWIAHKL